MGFSVRHYLQINRAMMVSCIYQEFAMARIARGEEAVDSAMQVIAHAVTVEQLRQAQAVVLPLVCAMSLQQTAEVTGLSIGWVSKQRNRFIQGKAVGDGTVPARGGRRRQNFTLQEETAVLKPFLAQAREGAILVVSQIKPHLEQALGRPVSLSSVYSLLHRHDWRKLAPDKRHPHSDPEAQQEWKKNSPKRSRTSARTGKASPSG
jgi:transposase